MKNLIIIGAGGYGREVYNLAIQCVEYKKDFIVKGFIDDNLNALQDFEGYPPIISDIKGYKIQENDIFTCAIGNINLKKQFCVNIIQRKGEFVNLIHPSVLLNKNVKIGNGVIIFLNSNISNDCIIEDFVTIQGYVGLGHDTKIEKWSHLNAYVFTGGFVNIGTEVTINTRATILPGIKVNKNAIVGACSLVIKNVKESTTVFGVPAKKIEY
jgi:sugar O-acyltransferase (sialic acid O-acetyltransferase NeuD family)